MTPTPDQEKTAGRAGHGGSEEYYKITPQPPARKLEKAAILAVFDCRKYLESKGAKHLGGDCYTAPWRDASKSYFSLNVKSDQWYDSKYDRISDCFALIEKVEGYSAHEYPKVLAAAAAFVGYELDSVLESPQQQKSFPVAHVIENCTAPLIKHVPNSTMRSIFDGNNAAVDLGTVPEQWCDLAAEAMHIADIGQRQQMMRRVAEQDSELMAALAEGDEIEKSSAVEKLPLVNAAEWLNVVYPPPEHVIPGLLSKGLKGALIGSSKARKSYFLLQTALAVAAGRPLLNFGTPKARKVLLVQLEIPDYSFHERFASMVTAQGFQRHELENLTILNGRGWAAELMKMSANRLIDAVTDTEAELVILDPLYKLLDGDENLAKDMKPVLAVFDDICNVTGAALMFAHHNSKGLAGDRQAIDRGAGSGVLARDFDAAIYLGDHKQDGLKVVETVARCFPPMDPFSIRWDLQKNCFVLDETAACVKTTNNAAKSMPVDADKLLAFIEQAGPLQKSALDARAREALGCSERGYKAALIELQANGSVDSYRERGKNGWTLWGTSDQVEKVRLDDLARGVKS